MKLQRYTRWADVPTHLKTKTQLGREGLKPGGEPVAQLYSQTYQQAYDLYDAGKAAPRVEVTEAQRATLKKARQVAEANHKKRQELELAIENLDHELMIAGDRAAAARLARETLACPPYAWCVLDTETTGLDDDAEAVQIGVLSGDGVPLLDTLVQPQQAAVGEGAYRVHRIGDDELSSAPTFAQVYPLLKQAIQGKLVVIYNRDYDKRILRTGYRLAGLEKIKVGGYRCAMILYAQHYGDWNEKHQEYKWQRLNGDHSALGDCRATLELLRYMAADDEAESVAEELRRKYEAVIKRWRELQPGASNT